MKGWSFRLKRASTGVPTPDDDADTFKVTLGEMRAALGHEPDPKTDHLGFIVEAEADEGDQKKKRRWF